MGVNNKAFPFLTKRHSQALSHQTNSSYFWRASRKADNLRSWQQCKPGHHHPPHKSFSDERLQEEAFLQAGCTHAMQAWAGSRSRSIRACFSVERHQSKGPHRVVLGLANGLAQQVAQEGLAAHVVPVPVLRAQQLHCHHNLPMALLGETFAAEGQQAMAPGRRTLGMGFSFM